MPLPLGLLLPLLSPLIGEVAPRLLGAVTGSERAETAAAAILPALGQAAGFPITSPVEAARAVETIRADPARLALASADLRAIEEAHFRDLADARARDLAVRKMSGGENRRADLLLVSVVALLVACLGAMVWIGVSVAVETPHLAAATGLLGTAAGFLLRGLSSALDFEFGSSRGSKEKDARLAPRAAPDRGNDPRSFRESFSAPPSAAPMRPIEEPEDRRGGLR